jgi:hypothetical protein
LKYIHKDCSGFFTYNVDLKDWINSIIYRSVPSSAETFLYTTDQVYNITNNTRSKAE